MTPRVSPRVVAITGSTGFIGRNIAAHFLERGTAVRAIIRPDSTRAVLPGATTVRAALDAGQLVPAFRNVDVVVHVAGISEASRASEFHVANVEGTRAVALAANTAKVPVVFLSSLAAAGPATDARPHSEDDVASPVTPYGVSKLHAERELSSAGAAWTALRPGPVYGPWDRAFLRLFRYARRGMVPFTGHRQARYSFVHVDDLVRAVVAAIERGPSNSAVFVGHPVPVTLVEVLSGIRAVVNPHARIVPVPLAVSRCVAIAMHGAGAVLGRAQVLNRWRVRELASEGFVCRVDRLRDQLGVVANVDLDAGLAQTAAWYRREGWL